MAHFAETRGVTELQRNDGGDQVFQCPQCGESFKEDSEVLSGREGEQLVCRACGSVYPYISDRVPYLVPSPMSKLADEALRVASYVRQGYRTQEALREQLNAARRPTSVTRLKRRLLAEEANTRFAQQMLRSMASSISPMDVLEASAGLPQHADDDSAPRQKRDFYARLDVVLAYLRRDWGAQPESEAEVTTLVDGLLDGTTSFHGNRVLVLGAGVGRVAEELVRRRSWDVVCLEGSALMSLAYCELRHRSFEFFHGQPNNRRFAADVMRRFVVGPLRSDGAVDGKSQTKWIVGDALASPFADQTFDLIASVYFTDCVPPSELIPEVRRLLRPEGRFVHVGPLGYHFEKEGEYAAADELESVFTEFGFATNQLSSLRSTFLIDPDALFHYQVDNVVFVGTKRG